jgi:Zn-dependent peptidase ImmA (M78 family)
MPDEGLPNYDLRKYSDEELPDKIEESAESLRKEWNLGQNPIPNVHLMLEEHGVKVKFLDDRNGFEGFSSFAQTGDKIIPTVALSRKGENDNTRLRFTALHELGHLILDLPNRLTGQQKERACHRFAGAFLLPQEVFMKTFGRNRLKISVAELVAIKEEWGISCYAVMTRARDLTLITPGRYKSFCIQANRMGWRKNEPGKWKGSEESSRFKQLVFRALAEEVISSSKACGLLSLTGEELAESFEYVG